MPALAYRASAPDLGKDFFAQPSALRISAV
jgi:hypothetical protein